MCEINLMDVYPPSQRTWELILERSSQVTPEKQEIGRRFGSEYFDGDSSTGYGGYRYDGRWVRIAERLRDHYRLTSGSRILDVGCAKGFLVKDLMTVVSGCKPFGLDLSEYAIQESPAQARAQLCVGSAHSLPFGDNQFDLVVSINALHYLPYDACKRAFMEIQRVSGGSAFVMVNAFRNAQGKDRSLNWDKFTRTALHVDEWKALFRETGYTGNYYWFFA